MRRILIALTAALLAACAAPAPVQSLQSLQGNSTAAVVGVATLANWGEWESELAPAYTAVAVVMYAADGKLKAGLVSIDTAKQIKAKGGRALSLLDASRRGSAKNPTQEQRAQLIEARLLIAEAEKLMEVKK